MHTNEARRRPPPTQWTAAVVVLDFDAPRLPIRKRAWRKLQMVTKFLRTCPRRGT